MESVPQDGTTRDCCVDCLQIRIRKKRPGTEQSDVSKGRWLPDPLPRLQVCGEVYSKVLPLILSGECRNVNEAPWHVGVFKKKNSSFEHTCGASIVTAKMEKKEER